MPDTTIGSRLRALREQAGLTQVELARQTGLRRATVADIETGRVWPHRSTLERLAAVLGVTLGKFIGE